MKTIAKNDLKINTLLRLDRDVKIRAQKAALSINLPLSSVVNNYLLYFGEHPEHAFEYPSKKMIKMIDSSRKDLKSKKMSPAFDNAKDAMKWLSLN